MDSVPWMGRVRTGCAAATWASSAVFQSHTVNLVWIRVQKLFLKSSRIKVQLEMCFYSRLQKWEIRADAKYRQNKGHSGE